MKTKLKPKTADTLVQVIPPHPDFKIRGIAGTAAGPLYVFAGDKAFPASPALPPV